MNYKALFFISLAANIAIGFYAFRKPSVVQFENPVRDVRIPISQPTVKPVESNETNAPSKRFNWESVESEDYRQYIANLRAIGCPEETIRDIIRADVIKLFEEKKRQVRKNGPKFEYWKGDDFIRGTGRDVWMKMFSLNEERDGVLRALGIEPDESKRAGKNSNAMDWMLDFLGDDKKAQVLRLRQQLDDRLQMRDPSEDLQMIPRLMKENDDAIKRLLTPDEALQYDLRFSQSALTLRSQLSAFEPTEQEFVALYKARKTFEEGLPATDPGKTGAERRAAREAAERQWQEQAKQALAPERLLDYQLAQDPVYTQMYNVAKQSGLGTSEAKQIYEIRRQANEKAAEVRDRSNFSAEKREAVLEAIRQETERSLQTILGDKAWSQINQGANNLWLNEIYRRPSKP